VIKQVTGDHQYVCPILKDCISKTVGGALTRFPMSICGSSDMPYVDIGGVQHSHHLIHRPNLIPMARKIATNRTVKRDELLNFIGQRHRGILSTTRSNGRPQMSLITMGLDNEGRVVVATYPQRVKVMNARRNSVASLLVMGQEFNSEWVQVDGDLEVLDLPEALDPLCDYFRSVSGEHPDWDEYRDAMVQQGKALLRLSIATWSPISQGGFPAHLAE
jgi:PPOX class probable F420-dependent enzyme